ncbi:hypothetical protein NDU88_008679 [Pleurodeles waltl]|uniref:Uncharacterized protein n=1 Tax=Pleurodeles waltl TaxID=8319 RepID=A0AAV7RT35_PLEWA|nr:hypothetical protein NDU88_008679 [Pleurodeles waltl]
MPAAGVSHFAPAPGERSLCRAFPVLGRLPFACSRSPDRALWAGPQPRGQIQLGVEFCRWRVGDGVRRPAGGGPRHPSQIKAPLQERPRCYCRREPLCRAPLLRRRSPAIGTARLQPRSATIRPLP